MRKHIYARLAAQNIKKNSKYFFPYLLTGSISVSMFFIVYSLAINNGLGNIYGGAQLRSLLSMSMTIAALFFGIFLFYTSSFLTKRRSKEYGLYSVLGMEKKHICLMSFYESVYTTLISLSGGFVLGILLSKLVYLILAQLLHFEVKLGFEFHWEAFALTAALFIAIYVIIFFNTVRVIGKSSAVDLLHAEKAGEKEPKTKIIMTVLGVLCLGAGYFIAITTKSPIEAIALFVIAALLVMVGTYFLFTAGSIALLKLLRKKKTYYYNTRHFVSVSGMMYRMKQNAVGLASICILCTAVLIMISTTASLYGGMDDLIRTRYPRNFITTSSDATQQTMDRVDDLILNEAKKNGVTVKNVLQYRSTIFGATPVDGVYQADSVNNFSTSAMSSFTVLLLEDYNRSTGKNTTLGENEILIQAVNGKADFESINFNGMTLNIKEKVEDIEIASSSIAYLMKSFYIVVPDFKAASLLVDTISTEAFKASAPSYTFDFDTDADHDAQVKFYNTLRAAFEDAGIDCSIEGSEESRDSFYSIYGGLLFIGIFLGFIFMLATVLIIYYKQVSEGYDDRERFEIMQKVGMDKREVRRSIRSQVLTVFFMPLAAAIVHLCFAFPIITRLLAILNLTNISIFVIGLAITTVVFAGVYAAVYALTAKAYYKIVS